MTDTQLPNPDTVAHIFAILCFADYAAQFQSEEYAGLVKDLRDGIIEHRRRFAGDTHDDLGGTADYEKTHAMTNRAADAIEALLAERAAWKGRQEATAALLKQAEAERDALAARLAPVDDEALVKIVGRTLRAEVFDPDVLKVYGDLWAYDEQRKILKQARSAIAAIRPHIEAVERERCAKIAETPELWLTDKPTRGCDDIAAAIRSGK